MWCIDVALVQQDKRRVLLAGIFHVLPGVDRCLHVVVAVLFHAAPSCGTPAKFLGGQTTQVRVVVCKPNHPGICGAVTDVLFVLRKHVRRLLKSELVHGMERTPCSHRFVPCVVLAVNAPAAQA